MEFRGLCYKMCLSQTNKYQNIFLKTKFSEDCIYTITLKYLARGLDTIFICVNARNEMELCNTKT